MPSIPHLIALLVASALLTHLLMPMVRQLGLTMGLVDHPSWRRAHREAIPCSGGIAIYAAVLIVASVLYFTLGRPFPGSGMLALVAAGLGTLVLGILDDRFGLHAEKKLLGQIVVVTLPMAAGLTLERVSLPGVGIVELGVLGGPLTLFWYLGFINSVNLIDGLDGLAGGIVVGVLAALGVTLVGTDPIGLVFVVGFLGSVLGFLRSNLSGRRIFLGDAGSMLLGLWLAGLTLGLATRSPMLPGVAVAAMAIPILDTATTIIRRRRRGVSVFRADDEHLHHRLLRLGMTPRRAAGTLLFATVAAASLGVLALGVPSAGILALGAIAAASIELAYTLPRQGRPGAREALGYLFGWRDGLGSPAVRQHLAEIIEMPRYRTSEWPSVRRAPAPVSGAPLEETGTGAETASEKTAEEGAKKREDVLLAITEEHR